MFYAQQHKPQNFEKKDRGHQNKLNIVERKCESVNGEIATVMTAIRKTACNALSHRGKILGEVYISPNIN